ncbi:MAG: esterase/lipase family protein [Ignavibacteriales bacterium]
MKKYLSLLLITLMMLSTLTFAVAPTPAGAATAPRQNYYPIILVHGLAGFDNVLGIYQYWGGQYNVSKDLKSRGYENYVASVGPFSSNWDRACELYAEIKGGTVDYGAAHAAQYKHARFGRTYPGFYPQWGETDPTTGKIKKVQLIGHSMGGTTSRALVTLLAQGNAEEAAASPNDLSPLFIGDKDNWVNAVLTVATPHDGSTATYALTGRGASSLLQYGIVFLTAVGGKALIDVYDLYLDQWGLVRQPGESTDSYLARVDQMARTTDRDLSVWDLKLEGAKELNGWATAQPNVYYFSQAASCTFKDPLTGHYLPSISMNPFFSPFAAHMGSFTQETPVPVDKTWWENDGLVSLCTADGPHVNSTDKIADYTGTPIKGQWNYLGKIKNIDHAAIAGILTTKDVRPIYQAHAQLLGSLPE